MDNVNQVLYGPTEDKLKLGGTAWLCLSLIANFGRADLGGFVGLLAVLAVVNSSDYLLRLFLVLAPISVFAGIVYLFQHVWSWGWVFLQLLHFAVQGASIWWAYTWLKEGDGEASRLPQGDDTATGPGPRARNSADPFQAYVPPQSNSHDIYQQQEQPLDRQRPQQAPAVPPQNAHPQEGQLL